MENTALRFYVGKQKKLLEALGRTNSKENLHLSELTVVLITLNLFDLPPFVTSY